MVPYAKAIVWNNKDNRRNINMFLDMVKSVAVYSIRRREKFGDAFLANDDDFKMANKIYKQISATNTTNLSLVEMNIMRFLHEVTSSNGKDKSYENGEFWVDAEDKNSGGATLEQVADHIKMSTGTARNLLLGKNGGKGLIHKVPGLVEIKKTVSRMNKESGIGKSKPKHIFVYRGGSMGIDSYGDTATLDIDAAESAISEFKNTYEKEKLLNYNDLHKFYTGCNFSKRDAAASNDCDTNLNYNKSNILKGEKKEASVCDEADKLTSVFSKGVILKSSNSVNLVNTGPADSDRKINLGVNIGKPKLKIPPINNNCDVNHTEKGILADNTTNNENSHNAKESVNDEPGENTLEMKRLSKKAKYEILDKMKVHFEGSKGVKLTAKNLNQFGRFVQKEYDDYSIHDVTIDTKNKFNLEASA